MPIIKTHSPVCSKRVLPNLSLSHFFFLACSFLMTSGDSLSIGLVLSSSIYNVFRAHVRQFSANNTTPAAVYDLHVSFKATENGAGDRQPNPKPVIFPAVTPADLIKPF